MGKDAKHVVRLTVAERVQLEGIVADSRAAKSRVLRSRMLLKADADGPAWPDSQIAEAFDVNAITVSRLRKRCVWEGLDAALVERPRSGHKPRKLDGAGEAQLIAIACGAPPEGQAKWTMQLLADKLIELEIVEKISDEAVRLTLKKDTSRRSRQPFTDHMAYRVRAYRLFPETSRPRQRIGTQISQMGTDSEGEKRDILPAITAPLASHL